MPEKEENTHQPSLPLNQPTESYSALKTWKWILSFHLLFCAHAKRNKYQFSFVSQMRARYLETGLYFLHATELQHFRPSCEWQVEEITVGKYCGLQDLLPKCYTYKPKHYQWSLLNPRATMISAVASVCLWAGTTRSLAGDGKWAEVAQSLWLFAWHYQTGSAKKSCLKHTTRGWDCASWCRFQHVPGCGVLLWVTASWVCASQSTTTGPVVLCRASTRIKVSISKHGSTADPTQQYNLRLNSPN